VLLAELSCAITYFIKKSGWGKVVKSCANKGLSSYVQLQSFIWGVIILSLFILTSCSGGSQGGASIGTPVIYNGAITQAPITQKKSNDNL